MEQELRNLVDAGNRAMVSLGVKVRVIERNGLIVAQAMLPTRPRPLLLEAHVAMPSDVVGGKLGKKIKAKVKTVAKKVAKSKLLKTIAKVSAGLALATLPGGPAIAAGAKAVGLAKKLKAVAKKGTPKQKAVAKAIAKAATKSIQRVRANAAPVPQGYPQPLSARVPDNRVTPDAFGNGAADQDPEELEAEMDPDQGAPMGEVEADVDEEIPSDEDTSSDDAVDNDYPE